jgi:hypothetical protein
MAEPEYAKRLLSAVLSVCDKKMFMMQRSLALLITSAVPQRFPKLRFAIVEGGIGSIPAQLRFMDHWWEDHHRWMQPKLDESPSTYFKRQFWATFEDDRPERPDAPSTRRGPADVGFGLSSHRGHFPIFDPTDQPGFRRRPRRRDATDGAQQRRAALRHRLTAVRRYRAAKWSCQILQNAAGWRLRYLDSLVQGQPSGADGVLTFVLNTAAGRRKLAVTALIRISPFLDYSFLDFRKPHLFRLHPDWPTFDFLSGSI